MANWINFDLKAATPIATIAVSVPVAKTEINAAGIQIVRDNTRYVVMNRSGTSPTMIRVGGDILATGNIIAYSSSDRRLKENIKPIDFALNKIEKINGVQFDWVKEYIDERGGEDGYFVKKGDVGVIAQEIEEILPEIVSKNGDGYKAVRYEKIVPLLIQAIKELKKEIDIIKNKL